jgi:hypothetical protein
MGEHYAYQHLGVVHARTVLFRAPDTWIVADLLQGTGSHLIESFLHFHPAVRVEPVTDLQESTEGQPLHRWTLGVADQPYLLTACGAGKFEMRRSWYAEQFGDRQPSTALHSVWHGAVPTGIIYVFTPVGTSLPRIAADWAGNSIAIDGHSIRLR